MLLSMFVKIWRTGPLRKALFYLFYLCVCICDKGYRNNEKNTYLKITKVKNYESY